MGMAICDICGEIVAKPYLRLIGSGQACEVKELKKVCIDCSGYKDGFEK